MSLLMYCIYPSSSATTCSSQTHERHVANGCAGATLKLQWLSAPSTVLVVAKPSPRVQEALQKVVAWLLNRHLSVILEPQVLSLLVPVVPDPSATHCQLHCMS